MESDSEEPLAEKPQCELGDFESWLMKRWTDVEDHSVFDNVDPGYAQWVEEKLGGQLHLLGLSATTCVGWRPVERDTVIRNAKVFMLAPRLVIIRTSRNFFCAIEVFQVS